MRLIVDVSGLVYRSAYSLHLTDREGRDVGAAYGTIKALGQLAEARAPEEMVICWDDGHDAQSRLYPAYKMDRKKDPEFIASLVRQKEALRRLLECLPVVNIQEPGVEADDVIAVLAAFLHCERVGIVTGDTDLYCLSGPRCTLYNPDGVKAVLTLAPEQYVPYKVLVGGEDGIKGVDGIGDVKARRLLEEHKTLDGILAHARAEGGLGKMGWEEVQQEVNRNLRLMTPGALLTPAQRKSILDQYRYGRLNRRLDTRTFRGRLMEVGFVSIVSRLTGYTLPFKRMLEFRAPFGVSHGEGGEGHGKATEESARGARAAGGRGSAPRVASGERRKGPRWVPLVLHVAPCVPIVRKVCRAEGGRAAGGLPGGPRTVGGRDEAPAGEGQKTAAERACEVLARLRAQAFVGLAAPGNRRGAEGVVPDGDGQGRTGRAGRVAAGVLPDADLLPRQPPGGKALSVVQGLSRGPGWQWLRTRPTQDLQRVLSLIERVLEGGKAVPVDDEEWLLNLEQEFMNAGPSWMATDEELKDHAKNITGNVQSRSHRPSRRAD